MTLELVIFNFYFNTSMCGVSYSMLHKFLKVNKPNGLVTTHSQEKTAQFNCIVQLKKGFNSTPCKVELKIMRIVHKFCKYLLLVMLYNKQYIAEVYNYTKWNVHLLFFYTSGDILSFDVVCPVINSLSVSYDKKGKQ